MNKKILFFSRDPGGTNVIAPVIVFFKKNERYRLSVWGQDFALKHFPKFGLKVNNFNTIKQPTELKKITFLLETEKPNLILTATSTEQIEKKIWECAKKLKIPSIAILDQWMNLELRFSKYNLKDLSKHHQKSDLKFVPNYIFVADSLTKRRLVKIGISGTKVCVTGNPYFEHLSKKKVAKNLTLNNYKHIVFVSEPFQETYGNNNPWGYDEISIFAHLLRSLAKIRVKNQRVLVTIKFHPKCNTKKYDTLIESFQSSNIMIEKNKSIHYWNLLSSANVICGMSSMLLIESSLKNLPILSIQIGLKKDNPFYLTQIGVHESILDIYSLDNKIQDILSDSYVQSNLHININNHGIQNSVKKIKEIL